MIDDRIIANFLRDTARTLILPRFRALESADIREKKPGDLVTVADIEAERELTRLLGSVLPGAHVIGEESVAEDPTRLQLLSSDAPVWIIDPVDGTANFAKGMPGFAVIVALALHGAVEAGWIYDPLSDVIVSGRKGKGAWIGERRLEVAADIPPDQITGSAYGRAKSGIRAAKALKESGRVGDVRNQGCSGLEYMALAQGITQFSLHSRSLPWDHAAGMLIVNEAGGRAMFLDGASYDTRIPDRPVLAAASEAGWQIVHDVVAA
jgi:fructose-1,6-bisphosphatase/inositol monophosphatase family enzyme